MTWENAKIMAKGKKRVEEIYRVLDYKYCIYKDMQFLQ